MFWSKALAKGLDKNKLHIINDSKTPSGRAHVGALRGVVIHDVMFRTLKEQGFAVRYLYGVDDYDPLDELPYGEDEHFRQYLGAPLCQVPPPPNSTASDMADYYINEFFEVFEYLGIQPEIYRLREIYRSGQFNEMIDRILSQAVTIRKVYKKVSNADRPAHWYPLQVVCENCGRIGTTEVSAYDGKMVTYTCRPNLVKWAQGCGYQGKVSPFMGNSKLPWKLEWVAKWAALGITIEGAGKDHTTKGGSREVASHCLQEIFQKTPPLNIPYEFFLVEGAKMSSSRGIGASAKDMANLLPPEILRFLMLRSQPHKPINFSPSEQFIVKLFNEFDRYHAKVFHDPKITEEIKAVYQLSTPKPEGDYFTANIQLLQALVQMPHLDVLTEMQKRKAGALTAIDLAHLQQRIQSVKYWLAHYAQPEERLQLQTTLPESAQKLSATQRVFLHQLAMALPTAVWEGERLQAKIFDVARLIPIRQPLAFQAIYQVLFGRDAGPRAGNLLEFLDKDFVMERLQMLPFSQVDFWRETALTTESFAKWLQEHQADIQKVETQINLVEDIGALTFFLTLADNKTYGQRLLFNGVTAEALQTQRDTYLKKMT